MLCGIRSLLLWAFILASVHAISQPLLEPRDTFSRSRFMTVASAGTVIYGATIVGLNHAWYKDFERSPFHFFDDRGEWQNSDKMGHLFTAYFETELSYRGAKWTGMKDKNAAWLAAGLGTLFQSTLEVFDGFSSRWGFSVHDMAYNIGGVVLFTAQQLTWKDQRIRMKVSSWPKTYPSTPIPSVSGNQFSSVRERSNDLFGSNFFEQYLKDYNAQTIWLSFNPGSFTRQSALPQWLNIAIGYGGENLFGGYSNIWANEGGMTFDLNHQSRYKQWYLAPDIDFRRIPTKSPFLRTVFTVLNIFKMPSPALEYNSLGKFRWHWIFL